jgi:hypothetical protein
MAFNHISFNDQTQYGRILRRAVNMAEEADDALNDVVDMMTQMRDGDGTVASHYAECTARMGFASDAKAKDCYDLLKAASDDISTNASVVNVKQRRGQVYARLRG